jgi:hypothetical protein
MSQTTSVLRKIRPKKLAPSSAAVVVEDNDSDHDSDYIDDAVESGDDSEYESAEDDVGTSAAAGDQPPRKKRKHRSPSTSPTRAAMTPISIQSEKVKSAKGLAYTKYTVTVGGGKSTNDAEYE